MISRDPKADPNINYNIIDESITKGPVSHTITRVQRTKNEEFWTVRCDSLGVRQNSLTILRERRMNVIHLLCASTSAYTFCMLKNVNVFSTCECRRYENVRPAPV